MNRDPIGYRVKKINNLMKRAMDKKMGHKPDKATMMHIWIIDFIRDRENEGIDTFQKDIEAEFSINRSTTSEMLTLMTKKGMVERVPVEYDARLKKVVLTQKAREYNDLLKRNIELTNQQLSQGLSKEEVDFFIRICDRLIENMQNDL